MTQQRIAISIIATLLLSLIGSLDVLGVGLYQTIPDSVYLPIVVKQELPTATPTATLAPIATITPTVTPAPTLAPTATSRPNCDPSYPTVCIPPPPPDLDCKNIPYRRFRVLPPDPHNFDTDHDGIGCES